MYIHTSRRVIKCIDADHANHAILPSNCSEYPNVEEQEEHGEEEPKPHPPANTGAVSHTHHAVHRPPQSNSGIIKGIIQLGHMCRIADFVSNGECNLRVLACLSLWCLAGPYIFQHLDFRTDPFNLRIVLRLQ